MVQQCIIRHARNSFPRQPLSNEANQLQQMIPKLVASGLSRISRQGKDTKSALITGYFYRICHSKQGNICIRVEADAVNTCQANGKQEIRPTKAHLVSCYPAQMCF